MVVINKIKTFKSPFLANGIRKGFRCCRSPLHVKTAVEMELEPIYKGLKFVTEICISLLSPRPSFNLK
jgi:hypothetical protein